jgi:hypothetical protein
MVAGAADVSPLMEAIRGAIAQTQGDVLQTCERVIQWLGTLSIEEIRAAFNELNRGIPDTPPTARIQEIVDDAHARSRGDEALLEAIFRERLDSLQLAESHLTQRPFGQILGRIERLARYRGGQSGGGDDKKN